MMKDYRAEIERLEQQLQAARDEKAAFDRLLPEYRLAEALHDLLCHADHTDGCGWLYERWDSGQEPVGNSTRMRYAGTAMRMFRVMRDWVPVTTAKSNIELATFAIALVRAMKP